MPRSIGVGPSRLRSRHDWIEWIGLDRVRLQCATQPFGLPF